MNVLLCCLSVAVALLQLMMTRRIARGASGGRKALMFACKFVLWGGLFIVCGLYGVRALLLCGLISIAVYLAALAFMALKMRREG